MDAITHPETQKHLRLFRGAALPVAQAVLSNLLAPGIPTLLLEAKRLAMDAISNVETVAQVGRMRMGGGIALYAGRIREVDRETTKKAPQRHSPRTPLPPGRDMGRE